VKSIFFTFKKTNMKAQILEGAYRIPYRDGKKSSTELIHLGGYDFVTDEALEILASENPKIEPVKDIVLVEFEDYVPDYEIVTEEFKNLGLELPQMQDLLAFGSRYRGFQKELLGDARSYLIIFPHYPWLYEKDKDYHPSCLNIEYTIAMERGISTFWFGTQIGERRYFAARKP
jgi:hypothetical protein